MSQVGYHITIRKVTREFVAEREFVGKDDERANDGAYYVHEKEENIEREVYSQVVDNLDIVRVIGAININSDKDAETLKNA